MQFCRALYVGATRSLVSVMAASGNSRSLSVMPEKQSGHGGSIRVSDVSDNVAVITMDRGENRMNDEFVDQMNAALDEVLSMPAIKAVITTSHGKFYCNGLDLPWLGEVSSHSPDHIPDFVKRWYDINLRILTFPMPTVAALNGHTYAGGGVMSLCHDYRVMQTDRGWWCLNEAYLGLRFPDWIIKLCSLKSSGKGARSFLDANVFGRRFTAQEALSAGIIDDMCGSAELLPKARQLLGRVVPQEAVDRGFVGDTKQQIFNDVLDAGKKQDFSSFTSQL